MGKPKRCEYSFAVLSSLIALIYASQMSCWYLPGQQKHFSLPFDLREITHQFFSEFILVFFKLLAGINYR